MADARRVPPGSRLPTLTEVVAEGRATDPATPASADVAAPLTPADEARIVDAVLAGLLQRVDLMLEYRLREALAPLLARAADALVHDTRDELTKTLRDVVARAINQELARRKHR